MPPVRLRDVPPANWVPSPPDARRRGLRLRSDGLPEGRAPSRGAHRPAPGHRTRPQRAAAKELRARDLAAFCVTHNYFSPPTTTGSVRESGRAIGESALPGGEELVAPVRLSEGFAGGHLRPHAAAAERSPGIWAVAVSWEQSIDGGGARGARARMRLRDPIVGWPERGRVADRGVKWDRRNKTSAPRRSTPRP